MAAITVPLPCLRASVGKPMHARRARLTVCNSVLDNPQLDPRRYTKTTLAAVQQSVGLTGLTALLPGLAYSATQLAHNATDVAQPEPANVTSVVVVAGVVALLCAALYAQRNTAASPTADVADNPFRSPLLSSAAATAADAPYTTPEPTLLTAKPAAKAEQAEVSTAFLGPVEAPAKPAAVATQAELESLEASMFTAVADMAVELAPASPTPTPQLQTVSAPLPVLVEEPVAAAETELPAAFPLAVSVVDTDIPTVAPVSAQPKPDNTTAQFQAAELAADYETRLQAVKSEAEARQAEDLRRRQRRYAAISHLQAQVAKEIPVQQVEAQPPKSQFKVLVSPFLIWVAAIWSWLQRNVHGLLKKLPHNSRVTTA